jgi:hypothetical protein
VREDRHPGRGPSQPVPGPAAPARGQSASRNSVQHRDLRAIRLQTNRRFPRQQDPAPAGDLLADRGPNELASQREALALTDSARGRSITDGPAIEWKALLAERSLQPEGVRNSDYPCDLPLRRSWPLVRWARIRPLEGAASDTCPPNRSGCDLSRTDSTLAGNRSACTQAFIPRATGVRARLPEGVRNPDHLHSATESPLLASERAAARNR